MPILAAQNLRKSYDDRLAVADVGFVMEPGEIFGLLGPNGAGKSTTMMMVCGLLRPDGGTVLIDGEELRAGRHDLKRRLGVVPQDLAIYPNLTARANLRFFGRLYGLRGQLLEDRVDEALERTGLTPRADSTAATFSGGMKRRLNFGCALVHQPDLLILDEPTVGVDPQSRHHLLESVQHLAGNGMAILYASHYMEEVEEVCRRVAIIDQGQVVAEDSLEALLGRLTSEIHLRLRGGEKRLPPALEGVATLETDNPEAWTIRIERDKLNGEITLGELLAHSLEHIAQSGARLEEIDSREANLERLFLELTGSRLRD